MRFKKQENRAIQQLILGGLALICAGFLYLATIKQVTEAQLPAPKAQVKVTTTATTTSTSMEESTSQTTEATEATEAVTNSAEPVYQPPVTNAPVVEPVYSQTPPVVETPAETPVEEPVASTDGSAGE